MLVGILPMPVVIICLVVVLFLQFNFNLVNLYALLFKVLANDFGLLVKKFDCFISVSADMSADFAVARNQGHGDSAQLLRMQLQLNG